MEHKKTQSRWIDVSATISDGMVHWPGDPEIQIGKAEKIGVGGAVANVTVISTTAHVGTHVDAPLHFFADGKDIASLSLEKLIGPAKVFVIKNKTEINLDGIKSFEINKGDRILFRTRNSDLEWERMPFITDYVYLAEDAALYLADKGVQCIGVDYLSIGGKDTNPDVHRILLSKEIVIIEGLKLGAIDSGDYDMVCLPLKIKDSDGGPCRVILREL